MNKLAGALVMISTTTATAQPSLDCYLEVRRGYGLDMANSKQLCIGATSTAPAGCFNEAMDLGTFTQAQAVQLCAAATSDAPVQCVARLMTVGAATTAEYTVRYCAALQWPLVSPPTTSSPACLDAAQRIGISDTQALDVCRGSSSAEPAVCVEQGRHLSGLTDADLVDLCRPVVPFPLPG